MSLKAVSRIGIDVYRDHTCTIHNTNMNMSFFDAYRMVEPNNQLLQHIQPVFEQLRIIDQMKVFSSQHNAFHLSSKDQQRHQNPIPIHVDMNIPRANHSVEFF